MPHDDDKKDAKDEVADDKKEAKDEVAHLGFMIR